MTPRPLMVAALAAVGLVCIFSAITIVVSVQGQREHEAGRLALDRATKHRDAALDAVAYSCGFLAGQRKMIEVAGLNVPPPPESEDCATQRRRAAIHGFSGGAR